MKVSTVLEGIAEELKKPLPEPRVVPTKTKRKAKMAKKANKPKDEDIEDQDEDETEEDGDEDEAPKSKKAKKGGKDKKAKKKAKSEDDEDDGKVSIEDLAEEAGINAQSARVKLREAEMEKPDGGRWRWPDGSKGLKQARKALGL